MNTQSQIGHHVTKKGDAYKYIIEPALIEMPFEQSDLKKLKILDVSCGEFIVGVSTYVEGLMEIRQNLKKIKFFRHKILADFDQELGFLEQFFCYRIKIDTRCFFPLSLQKEPWSTFKLNFYWSSKVILFFFFLGMYLFFEYKVRKS